MFLEKGLHGRIFDSIAMIAKEEHSIGNKGSKSSAVWSYFAMDDASGQKATCRTCQTKVSYNSNRKARPRGKEV